MIFFTLINNTIKKFSTVLENSNLIILCNDYYDSFAMTFILPKTAAMFGIILLYDYSMYYLFIILIVVLTFLYLAVMSAHYLNNSEYTDATISDKLWLKKSIEFYIAKKINLAYNHNVVLEFYWTVIPAFILVCIAYPSFTLLYTIDSCIDPVYTITIIGNQWFWSYEYSDFDVHMYLINCFRYNIVEVRMDLALNKLFTLVEFPEFYNKLSLINKIAKLYDLDKKIIVHSNLVTDDRLPEGFLRLLTTDKILMLPSTTPVRLLVTSRDVIHSWAVPSFGIKIDAVPGRLNQVYFYSEIEDISWGQCSELCGVQHGFMPIEVHVVRPELFLLYLKFKLDCLVKEPLFYIVKTKWLTAEKLITFLLEHHWQKDYLEFENKFNNFYFYWDTALDAAIYLSMVTNKSLVYHWEKGGRAANPTLWADLAKFGDLKCSFFKNYYEAEIGEAFYGARDFYYDIA